MTKGWYGDRTRHMMASKGVRTTFNPRFVTHNGRQYLEADGVIYKPREEFINEVNGQLRCLNAHGERWDAVVEGVEGAVESVQDAYDDMKDSNQARKEINKERDATIEADKLKTETMQDEADQMKRDAKFGEKQAKLQEKEEDVERKTELKEQKEAIRKAEAEAGIGVGGAKAWLTDAGKKLWDGTKNFIQTSPSQIKPSPSTNMAGKSNLFGSVSKKRASDTNQPTDPKNYNDVTKDMSRSVDSDSIIATVENKEKLIQFANDLEHDIDLLEVSYHSQKGQFNTEERKDASLYSNEIRYAKDNFRDEIKLIKMSGVTEADMKFEIGNLKVTFEHNARKLKDALKSQKLQNRADLNYIDDLKDDLGDLHKQTDKRIKMMIASGHKR